MTEEKPGSNLVRIYSDEPCRDSVCFGFDGYALTLAGLITNRDNETPLVIGIFGSWGSGKTTLMEAIKGLLDGRSVQNLAERLGASAEEMRLCKTVWFQAWKYDKESEILAGLLETIFQTMAADDFFSKARGEIEKLAKGLNKAKILGFISKLATGIDVTEFFKKLEYKKELGFYDTFRSFFQGLIQIYVDWKSALKLGGQADDRNGALVVFIDDLDRCPKKRIVRVLETIKLFMDHKGCVFILGADRDIIVKALSPEYSELDAARFMEKIVQVSFSLPKPPEKRFHRYLDGLDKEQEEIKQYLPLILPAMASNPRQLKRFVNNQNLRHGIMRSSGLDIEREPVLLWGIIEHAFDQLTKDLRENPNTLFTIKDHLKAMAAKLGHRRFWEADAGMLQELNVGQSLHKYILNQPMVSILDSFEIEKESFAELLTYAASVPSPEAEADSPKTRALVGEQGETMVEVPAGPFKFGEGPEEARIEKPYWIDIYLVTNQRFMAFVDDGGYETEKWWPKEGWKWREEKRIIRPGYWHDPEWNQDDLPVIGVSWYEAAAFCMWLTVMDKLGFVYHLPDEKQWERAARGTDGRRYPWGNKFDSGRCNTQESGKGKTTGWICMPMASARLAATTWPAMCGSGLIPSTTPTRIVM